MIVLANSCLSASSKSFSEASRFEKPTIEFSGVRISWLMFAKNTYTASLGMKALIADGTV